jgi:hypothetical protein
MYKLGRRESGARYWVEEEGKMRMFILMRLVAAIVIALGLSVAAGSPSAAQDDEESGRTAAEDVRELVLKQRERVLAHVAAIMAGDEEDAESAEIDTDEAAEGEDEGEEEGEDGEGEDEGEDEEGEDEGVGGEDCEVALSGAVGGEAEGDAVASDEAEGDASADEAGSAEEETGESVGGEAEDAQPAGGAAETAGEQEVCTLPSTGTGTSDDTYSMLSALAALAAVVAAGFGLRHRFI